jgi:urocanate hydratase
VLFTRDHLDAAAMTHPRIGTEGMRDGSDGVSDFPLLDGLLLAATGADLVAIHSGGGGYSGWMQSAGVSIVADGAPATAVRLRRALDADTGLGVLRHAQAGYAGAEASVVAGGETGEAPLTWLHHDPQER